MKKHLLLLWLIVGLAGIAVSCLAGEGVAPEKKPGRFGAHDQAINDGLFALHAGEFINGYLEWRPLNGTSLGLHQYDGKITDFSKQSIASELARLKRYRAALADLPFENPSPQSACDFQILKGAIDNEIFYFEELSAYSRNPMTYARALDLNVYLKRDFAPLPARVRSMIAIEKQAHRIFTAARANLEPSLAKPFVETAIEIANGSADFLAKDLVDALKGLDPKEPKLMAAFKEANDQAIAELREFAKWLETDRLPGAHNHFALGRDNYQKMLHHGEMIDQTPEQILEIGLAELKREQAVFAEAAHKVDSDHPPIEVFKAIQKDHPTETSLLPDVRKNLEAIRQFLVDHQIISLPSEVRARVEETPQFDRATSFASMDTPGPFESRATEAFYYVTPTEKDWTPQQKEEWLTSFNYYTTDVVSIHEAFPGHYVQFLHLNASKATDLEKIFTSYAYVEGWAHYCEQMLLDEGFGKDEGDLKAARYRLAQSDEALLRICRLCVSIKMHCQGMTVDEAAKFFEDNCYYEPKPARQEAIRGTFDPGYLFYTIGKLEIFKLRRDWQEQEGAAYSLPRFHDEMLSHGGPPIRLLREQMLKDRSKWGEIF